MLNHTCEIPPSTGESRCGDPKGYQYRVNFNATRSTIFEVNSAEYSDPTVSVANRPQSISPVSSKNQAEKASASQGSDRRSPQIKKSDSNSSGCYSTFRKPPTESTFKQAGHALSEASSSVSHNS